MFALAIAFGAAVGFALGLTGGGGSILAVPLLVYGLSVAPHEAVGISLAAVGATALVGAIDRLRRREVELRTGLLFAVAGMIGAPLGTLLGQQIPETLLLLLFAGLMLWVAVRMWRKAGGRRGAENGQVEDEDSTETCSRDERGQLVMSSRCAALLAVVGLATGVLSGLFGVGGGFVIVPALVLFSGMRIRHAVATSLLVIALISAAGVAAKLVAGQPLSPSVTTLFIVGGIGGMGLGTMLARRLSPVVLQKAFSVTIVAVALFVIARTATG